MGPNLIQLLAGWRGKNEKVITGAARSRDDGQILNADEEAAN